MSGAPLRELRVLIVDDEPLARQRLATLVSECAQPACTVVGQCANAEQARQALSRTVVDVALLDVQMPGDTGLALAAQWQGLPRPPVLVFVTAFGEHALKAFELEAADYLTKPVRRERLHEALARAAKRAASTQPAANDDVPALTVSERGRLVRVPLTDVLYLKAELKYVTLRTAERSYLLDDALLDLEQRLGERFIRVHRNALVARTAVRLLEKRRLGSDDASSETGDANEAGWAVCIAPVNEWLWVSRRQVASVREALEKP
jgi:two-component system, LytTR family, response regulator AlgR